MDKQVLQKMARANPIATALLPSLRKMLPRENINEEIAANIYKTCIGINQQHRAQKGKMLEKCIEDVLKENNIPYLSQVVVDTTGIIHAFRGKKKGVHIHDFIINASFGDSVHDKMILSCKTSLRERWRQDANIECSKMYMITMDTCSKHVMASLKENRIQLVVVGGEGGAGTGMTLEECVNEIKNNLAISNITDSIAAAKLD